VEAVHVGAGDTRAVALPGQAAGRSPFIEEWSGTRMLTLVTFDHKLLGWVKPMHGQPLDVPCFQTWQPNKKVKSVPFQGST
jgi:hypothetical protein